MSADHREELRVEFADPGDPALDEFQSGGDEVDRSFTSRAWFDTRRKSAAPPTYKFLSTEGAVVGFAAVAFRRSSHPNDAAAARARYLVVYAVGVNRAFQGRENPEALGETYAATLFRTLERFALEKPDCVGLSLWVRSDNARGIAFYSKIGFEPDSGGPIKRDDGAPHLTMRKAVSRLSP